MRRVSSTFGLMLACWMLAGAPPAGAVTDLSPLLDDAAVATGKAWVDDFAAFASGPGGKRWVVGRSKSPCLSEAEAFESASRDACDQLYSRLQARLASSYGPGTETGTKRRLAQEL